MHRRSAPRTGAARICFTDLTIERANHTWCADITSIPARRGFLSLAALPAGVERVFLRADSALYDHSLIVFLDQRQVGFALSVPVSLGLRRRMQGLDEAAWHMECEDEGALRRRAALDYPLAA